MAVGSLLIWSHVGVITESNRFFDVLSSLDNTCDQMSSVYICYRQTSGNRMYSLCKELFRLPPIGRSPTAQQCAVDPILFLSFSGEDSAIDHRKRPRRSSTAALDVLSPRRASQQSVHFAKRTHGDIFLCSTQLRSAGPCSHGIKCHLLGCCTCFRCTTYCRKIRALRAR